MSDIRTEAGFRQHVNERRYSIYRQAVIDLKTLKPLHDEWLVRFDAEGGLADMIRPAEISGAITTLDMSMLGQAVKTLNIDKRRLPIAVNLSGASMDNPDFEDSLFNTLEKLDTDAERLIFELTETWDMHDLSHAERILARLSAQGHPVCLDDVGAGAASIRYLRAFKTQWLKFDGEFVKSAMSTPRDEIILKALLTLKDQLGVKLIAEGLETQQAVDYALSLGFDAGQGYFLGRPEQEPIRTL